jgi:hypothetical protein
VSHQFLKAIDRGTIMADDTRDIAIETRAEVRQLTLTVGELKEKVEELCTIAERAKGATGVLSLFGHTSSGALGAAAYGLYDNWNAVLKFVGFK